MVFDWGSEGDIIHHGRRWGGIDESVVGENVAKGADALNPRGERYSPDTIRGVLTMRDFMDTMRSSGNVGGGPPPLTQADRNAFASHLDKWLARRPNS